MQAFHMFVVLGDKFTSSLFWGLVEKFDVHHPILKYCRLFKSLIVHIEKMYGLCDLLTSPEHNFLFLLKKMFLFVS